MVYKVYNDAGISAHVSYRKRPELLKLIRDCQSGNIDVILFTKIDRWFRSIKDYYLVQEQLRGVPWKAIWENYDTETSDGQLKVNIMLSVAEAEAARTSERIKRIIQFKKEKGEVNGHVPLGYKVVDKHIVIDEETKPHVEAFFQAYFETHSVARAIDRAADLGVNISIDKAHGILKNTTYYGDHHGIPCDPYITKAQFDMVQEIRKRYVRDTTTNRVHLFSGLITCDLCNGRMRVSCQSSKYKDKRYRSYHYKCDRRSRAVMKHEKGVCVGETRTEKYLLAELDNLLANLRAEFETNPIDSRMEDYRKEKKKLEGKLERIKFLYMEGDLTQEEYSNMKADINRQLYMLSEPTECPQIELPDNWKEMYSELSREGKRSFWYSIIKEIRYNKETGFTVLFLDA